MQKKLMASHDIWRQRTKIAKGNRNIQSSIQEKVVNFVLNNKHFPILIMHLEKNWIKLFDCVWYIIENLVK